jgi:alkyl hydroperoxide reductase subunit AhpC
MKLKNTPFLCDFWPHGVVAQKYGLFREENGFSERTDVIVDKNQNVVVAKVYPTHSIPDIKEVIAFIQQLK